MRNDEPVVVTGAGLVSGWGIGLDACWENAKQGRSGLVPLTDLEADGDSTAYRGGQPPPLAPDAAPSGNPATAINPEAQREVRYLVAALDEALTQAGWRDRPWRDANRVAVVLGTTLAGMRRAARLFRGTSPKVMRTFLAGDIASAVADAAGARGACASISAACASGLSSVVHAACLLRSGEADVVIAGGYDPVAEYAFGGFNSLRLVSAGVPRPFMRSRDGLCLGEGYGLLVIERAENASDRGGRALAVVEGFGESSDGYHLTQPHPEGDGLAKAIGQALPSTGGQRQPPDLISLHGTGTPANDAAEYAALCRAIPTLAQGDARADAVAFKAGLGHTLGGAGAVELALTIKAMQEDTVPPTCGHDADDLEFPGLRLGDSGPVDKPIRRTLGLSLGFGGSNCAVVLGSEPRRATNAPPEPANRWQQCDLVVTGVGYAGSLGMGVGSLAAVGDDKGAEQDYTGGSALDVAALNEHAGGRRTRRMATYTKLVLGAAREAVETAGGDDTSFVEPMGAMIGTAHGASAYTEDYYQQLVEDGLLAANPLWFAEGVPNVGSAHISMALGVRGTAQTVLGTRAAGLAALHLARLRVGRGDWPGAVVAAGDEHSDLASSIYEHFGLAAPGGSNDSDALTEQPRRGFVSAHGAGALILEPADAADRAGRTALARLTGSVLLRAERLTPRSAAEALDQVLRRLGDPAHVICSGNRTWIDAAERVALRRSERRRGAAIRVWMPYANHGEIYAAGPLVAVSAALAGRDGSLPTGEWAVISMGYDGTVSGAAFRSVDR